LIHYTLNIKIIKGFGSKKIMDIKKSHSKVAL